ALAQAAFAELFLGPARQVAVSFSDLLGLEAPYNVPGIVSDANWSQRLVPGFSAAYRDRVRARRALDVPRAVATALRARGDLGARAASLARALEAAAGPAPGG
ncbi:MAG TPA: 4-alpha-glucanotransferase, partial [Anaeromyxobacteraceae bacterium]|nr:4-alpha-glucanotransferase [Anaeromyxobacteraceae bacterium]